MSALTEELREKIRAEFPKYPNKRAVTLPALHIVHDALRCVSTESIREIAELLEVNEITVRRDWQKARGFLFQMLESAQ